MSSRDRTVAGAGRLLPRVREALAAAGLGVRIRRQPGGKLELHPLERPAPANETAAPGLAAGEPRRWVPVGKRWVDVDGRRVVLPSGRQVRLTPREADLLRVLVRHRGRSVSRERLARELWPEGGVGRGAADTIAFRLRRKLEPEPAHPRWILTLRGRGLILLEARSAGD